MHSLSQNLVPVTPRDQTPPHPAPEADHPESSTTSTPTEAQDDGRTSGTGRSTVGRSTSRFVLDRLVPSAAAAPHRLRSAIRSATAGAGRIPPKMRSTQVGVAVTAMAVLGVMVGQHQPETGEVQAAAHTAPLTGQASPAPAPNLSPRFGPVGPAQDAEAPAEAKDQLENWIDAATDVLKDHGVPPEKIDEDDIRTIIEHESGGDPRATNGWDSNAAAGTPSKGLMQTIDPTFESYALPGHENIWNPVDNIIAASLYSIDRYGSVSEVPGVVEKDSGGSYEGY